ncbi:MAG: prepilin-type N-terminal cleavage/methylation domain-containing protein [Gemmatimonadaceae bacterium]|nr:prepilin-type N-terminal cleavage/methylation domain-containing protein [Gemmatimonadaceae bacterium]
MSPFVAARRRICTTAPRGGTRAARAGFTLVEILVVVVLLAILATMAIPKARTTSYRADAAALLARTLLQQAQRNAITRQSNVIVSIDTVYARLRIVEDYNNNDTLNTTDRVSFRRLEEGAHFAVPPMGRVGGGTATGSVQGSALRVVSALPGVIFRRDGSASTDMELYVTMRNAVAADYRALTVSPTTGRVDVHKWSGSAWIRTTQ